MERYVHYSDSTRLIIPALDALLIWGAFRLAGRLDGGGWEFGGYAPFVFVIFGLLWWMLSQQFANLYRLDRLISYTEKLGYVLRTFGLHAVLGLGLARLLPLPGAPLPYLALVYALAVPAVVGGRFGLAFGYRAYRRYVARPQGRFVLIGASQGGLELYRFLTAHDAVGDLCRGVFADGPIPAELRPLWRGPVAAAQDFCRRPDAGVDEIYYALPLDRRRLIEELSTFAVDNFLAFRIVPDYRGTVRQDVDVHFYDHLPILTVRHEPLGFRTNQLVKRAFDIVFAGLVVLLVFPVLLPVLALLIKLDSPGPVFFRQLRPGKHNRLFPCYKLRTMRCDHRQDELQASKADPRVTRIGAYLRKYNLDELPQFFNVLLGHMSVVGPRPNMISQLEEYSKRIRRYQLRHAVMPGITGYAQVNGWRGETRAPQAMEKRVEYDLKYLETWSFGLDLQIIMQTVTNMVRGEENAY